MDGVVWLELDEARREELPLAVHRALEPVLRVRILKGDDVARLERVHARVGPLEVELCDDFELPIRRAFGGVVCDHRLVRCDGDVLGVADGIGKAAEDDAVSGGVEVLPVVADDEFGEDACCLRRRDLAHLDQRQEPVHERLGRVGDLGEEGAQLLEAQRLRLDLGDVVEVGVILARDDGTRQHAQEEEDEPADRLRRRSPQPVRPARLHRVPEVLDGLVGVVRREQVWARCRVEHIERRVQHRRELLAVGHRLFDWQAKNA